LRFVCVTRRTATCPLLFGPFPTPWRRKALPLDRFEQLRRQGATPRRYVRSIGARMLTSAVNRGYRGATVSRSVLTTQPRRYLSLPRRHGYPDLRAGGRMVEPAPSIRSENVVESGIIAQTPLGGRRSNPQLRP